MRSWQRERGVDAEAPRQLRRALVADAISIQVQARERGVAVTKALQYYSPPVSK